MQDDAGNEAAHLESEIRDLMHAGKLDEAVAACKRLNHEYPAHVPGWFTASRLALQVNEPRIALRAIEQALVLSPGQPELLLQQLICLVALEEIVDAMALGRAIGLHRFPDAQRSFAAGTALARIGLHDLARNHFEFASELEPGVASHHYNLAKALRELGRSEEAEDRLDRALEIDPGDTQAHLLRSGLRTQTQDNNHLSELNAAMRQATADPDRVHIGFALAKEYEDIGDYDKAFLELSAAATLRRAAMEYDPRSELDMMAKVRKLLHADLLDYGGGYVNAAPIFVVGLPCTGISLVNEILGAHSVVTSTGELRNFAVELQKLCIESVDEPPSTPAEIVDVATGVEFEALGEAYIESCKDVAVGTAHFVDRMSTNFLYCGFIRLALPKAKMVLLQRDSMDTCFALYKTLFDGGYSYTYDLEELANYFIEFRGLAEHWRECLRERIHVVRYEDLVSGQRTVVEGLLDYCGLSHDRECFDVHQEISSGVRTSLSLSSPSGTWLNYKSQLQPLSGALAAAGLSDDE